MRYFLSSTLSFVLVCALLSGSAPAAASPEEKLSQLLDGFHEAASRADFSDYFPGGRGWTYQPIERFWRIANSVASFDEQLDNAGLGLRRESGVAILEQGEWKVAQYNLALLIPNGIVDNIVLQTKQATSENED